MPDFIVLISFDLFLTQHVELEKLLQVILNIKIIKNTNKSAVIKNIRDFLREIIRKESESPNHHRSLFYVYIKCQNC